MKPTPVQLYLYQRRWFLDRARFKIGMFARQTGKTFTTTLEIVDSCFQALTEGRRERWVILSRGERQAKEAMEEGVKRHARAYEIGFEALEYDWVGEQGTHKALEVELAGGSRITALPANPDTARGFSANVFLDEFALHKDSRAIWAALFPVISAGHKLRITSTPRGKGNKFYELMTGTDHRWSRHVVDIHKAVAEGLPRDIDELREALNDEDIWAQEYELHWLDAASAWLDWELIAAAEEPAAGRPDLYTGGPVYLGNDIARRNDLWVLWVWELVGDILWTRDIIERRRIPFALQDVLFDQAMADYRVVRAAMDQTGMGEKPVEDAQRRHGSYRVEGVLLTGPRRLDIATHARQAFEDRRVRIPAGNPALRADLHQLKATPSLTGAPRLAASADGDGHADRAWAAFLGIAAAADTGGPPAGESLAPVPATPRALERAAGLLARPGGLVPPQRRPFRRRA